MKLETEKFSSTVVDFFNHDLVIDYPISELTKKQSFFVEGTSFLAFYIGKDTAVYQFETEIIGRKIMQIPVLILRRTPRGEYKRIQRREYVRVKTSLEMVVSSSGSTILAVTFDLSGGGCSFFFPLKEKFIPNQVVSLSLALNVGKGGPKYVNTKAKIIRVDSFNTRNNLFLVNFMIFLFKQENISSNFVLNVSSFKKKRFKFREFSTYTLDRLLRI
ncbi:flagellar brake protein [Alkalihalobacillus sp. 1P02AB]|uniref:flagellar brake protein n=1 Tax=Alkalihalobacillus sp. 1P02AB TaxID=3132260 RepID=UPI0039A748D8